MTATDSLVRDLHDVVVPNGRPVVGVDGRIAVVAATAVTVYSLDPERDLDTTQQA